ncbi:Zn-dependent hydrolase [Sodalis sp. dw_96]|uniref:Zn-dependent hydrolase n=1 Tax=Sodalis sp. dw_96 TaxID=2719794 RepID=UPI00210608C0|nr:Zn-dependent hydrolase [Sodalis sp. dw_96]
MIEPDLELAQALFNELYAIGYDGIGVTRDTYGPGEQRAHDLIRLSGTELGLEARIDAALNLYLTLPGLERSLPAVLTGSHLDSVPRGGNYDGAAGVIAGMSVLASWIKCGRRPKRDVTVISIRAEESVWFPVSYIGSKSALGLLPADALEAVRFDTGKTLGKHMEEQGGFPETLVNGAPAVSIGAVCAFIELHIEQGSVLIESRQAIGIVTGICGSLRYRSATITGQYAHSGATPRTHRHDAVVAFAELVHELQNTWQVLEADGHELTLTFGQVNTDSKQSDFSKVAGKVVFCIDIRSRDVDTLDLMNDYVQRAVADLSAKHGVNFNLGEKIRSQPASMDPALRHGLTVCAKNRDLKFHAMPSGAGHDAAMFAYTGIPTAMIFIPNANGSHNPDEQMEMDDFSNGARVLSDILWQISNQ